jgi:hypothetical protein
MMMEAVATMVGGNQPGWWQAALESGRRKELQGQGQEQAKERSNRCGWLVVVLFAVVAAGGVVALATAETYPRKLGTGYGNCWWLEVDARNGRSWCGATAAIG